MDATLTKLPVLLAIIAINQQLTLEPGMEVSILEHLLLAFLAVARFCDMLQKRMSPQGRTRKLTRSREVNRCVFQAIESLTASADHRTNDLSMPLADVTAAVACSYKARRAEA